MHYKLVETGKSIGDPVKFMEDNPSLYKGHDAPELQIVVVGPDIEFFARGHERLFNDHSQWLAPTEVQDVSPILGSLYQKGISNPRFDGRPFTIKSFPSAAASNALSEELDLRPGVDVLRVVNQPGAVIGGRTFAANFRNGIYAQSLGPYGTIKSRAGELPNDSYSLFDHDRGDAHKTALWLSPPALLKGLESDLGRKSLRLGMFWPKFRIAIADALDNMTSSIDERANRLWPQLDKDFDKVTSPNPSPPGLPSDFDTKAGVWLNVEPAELASMQSLHRAVDSILFPHLIALKPRIEKLKLQRAAGSDPVHKHGALLTDHTT